MCTQNRICRACSHVSDFELAWCCHVEISMDVPEKSRICCSKMCSVLMAFSQMCKLPTNTPPLIQWETLAFKLCTGNLDGTSFLWHGEHNVHYFYKYSERLTCQMAFPLCISSFHLSRSPEKSAEFLASISEWSCSYKKKLKLIR